MARLIVYELNEVPPALLRRYVHLRPESSISFLYHKGFYRQTHTDDDGELHPWSTWPTVHRGVCNTLHGIRYINQDLASANKSYPPIWSELVESGIDVGVFGSLQSYPPLKGENVRFFVPDTFAPDSATYPPELRVFQDFNLSLAARNKAIGKNFVFGDLLRFLRLLWHGHVLPVRLVDASKQIGRELVDARWKKARPLLQPVFGFDLYLKLIREKRPSFSTFFTNHVAGMMHRYWRDFFPEDFGLTDSSVSLYNADLLMAAVDIADLQISKLLEHCRAEDCELWVLSSMGQQAVNRGDYVPELFLDDWKKFLNGLGLPCSEYEYVPSMQPDVNFKASSLGALNGLRKKLKSLLKANGKPLFRERYEPVGITLNLSLSRSDNLFAGDCVMFGSEMLSIGDLGLIKFSRDQGTGYHVPSGIFLASNPRSPVLLDLPAIVNTASLKCRMAEFFRVSLA